MEAFADDKLCIVSQIMGFIPWTVKSFMGKEEYVDEQCFQSFLYGFHKSFSYAIMKQLVRSVIITLNVISSVLNKNVLDSMKLKALADDKIYEAKILICFFDCSENIVKKRRKCWPPGLLCKWLILNLTILTYNDIEKEDFGKHCGKR